MAGTLLPQCPGQVCADAAAISRRGGGVQFITQVHWQALGPRSQPSPIRCSHNFELLNFRTKSKGANVAQARSLIGEARKLASRVPIDDKKASDKEIVAAFRGKSGLKAQMETEWENFARANYTKAKDWRTKQPLWRDKKDAVAGT